MAERTLPGLGLTGFWELGANSWKPGMDANLRLLSVIVRGWVKSRTAALPGAPDLGDIYIVPADAALQASNIAIWDGESGAEDWVYVTPQIGLRFYVEDEAKNYQWDNTAWAEIVAGGNGEGGSGGANWSVPHRGATVTMNSQTLNLSGFTVLSWNNEISDTDEFWDAAEPTQFKIPTDVTKVRLHAHLDIDGATIAANSSLFMTTRKNGIAEFPGTGRVACEVGFTNHAPSLHSGVIDVVEDDVLTVAAQFGSDPTVVVASAGSYFQLEVIEVDDAQDRDRDVPVFLAGIPSASTLVHQEVLIRAMTLKSGAPKSQAVARVAATNEAIFSITKNDVAIGTVIFAAGTTIGTFAMASDVDFAVGDRLGITSPAIQDTTLADISITLVLVHT